MARNPDIIASVYFYPAEQGGRKGPTSQPIFRCPLEFEGEKFDCGLHLEKIGPLLPGTRTIVPITLLYPTLIKSRLKIGSKFTLWDMRSIAEGAVEQIIPD